MYEGAKKQSGSPPEDLKANPQLEGRKAWRGTVEARGLGGSRGGARGHRSRSPPSPVLSRRSFRPVCLLCLRRSQFSSDRVRPADTRSVSGGGAGAFKGRAVSGHLPPAWFSWSKDGDCLPLPEPESEGWASLTACAGRGGAGRLTSVTLAVESREGCTRVSACVCVCVLGD